MEMQYFITVKLSSASIIFLWESEPAHRGKWQRKLNCVGVNHIYTLIVIDEFTFLSFKPILRWYFLLPYCFHFLRSSLISTGKLCLCNAQSLTGIKRERERDGERAWPISPWNPHIVSPQPMGDSYQNAARTIMKGYGNYGKHTHTYTHTGRKAKQAPG